MHGAETYAVPGEGELSRSRGGRRHPPGTAVAARYVRLGPKGQPLPEHLRRKVARAMTVGGSPRSDVPFGYAFLAELIHHDLTFDLATVTSPAALAPWAIRRGASPTLDLDSVYGAGPDDPASAAFYDGTALRTGATAASRSTPLEGHDLPRQGTGTNPAQRRRALVPDERTDENLAIAQIHLGLIRLHNHVLTRATTKRAGPQPFTHARAEVVKHVQWVVRDDLLLGSATPRWSPTCSATDAVSSTQTHRPMRCPGSAWSSQRHTASDTR